MLVLAYRLMTETSERYRYGTGTFFLKSTCVWYAYFYYAGGWPHLAKSAICNGLLVRPTIRLSVLSFSNLNRARVTHHGAARDAASIISVRVFRGRTSFYKEHVRQLRIELCHAQIWTYDGNACCRRHTDALRGHYSPPAVNVIMTSGKKG